MASPRKQALAPSEQLRRNQVLGLVLVALLLLVFALARADWQAIFPQGWWRL